MNRLFKTPAETRTYTFEFNGGVQGGPRETLWAGRLLPTGSGVSATLTATGSDGGPITLVLGSPGVSGTTVTATIGGGTDGVTYTLTCTLAITGGGTAVLQGQLRVVANLP